MREVVITGVGAVTPLGVGARTLHERWTAGACAVDGGEAPCADFDPLALLSRKEARRADRFTQFALAAAEEALADAGWDGEDAARAARAGGLRARDRHRWPRDARGQPREPALQGAGARSRRSPSR